MTAIWQDLRYAVRTFRQSPGFTLAAIFALALGIGANTAIFSVVNAVLLNSKPIQALREPGRLVMLWENNPEFIKDELFTHGIPVRLKNYQEWKKQSRSFEGLAMFDRTTLTVTTASDRTGSRPQRLDAARVTADFFPLLGLQPRLGRNFTAEEMQPGRGRVAIVSDELYRTRFHGDPNILEKSIQANGEQYQVVGVMPPKFQLPAAWDGGYQMDPSVWLPLSLAPNKGVYFIYGRLKRGVSLGQARAEMAVIAKRVERADPEPNRGFGVTVYPIAEEDVSRTIRHSLLVLQAAVAFVLLIACANVANLLLTRAAGRQREVAIRAALGASRLRLVRQMLTESLLLAMMGGAAGLLLSFWGLDSVAALAPPDTHGFRELRIDPMVLCFTILASMLAAFLFGLAPSLHAMRQNVSHALSQGARSVGGRSGSLRNALVISEIALSFVLLIGAGLMIRTLASLMAVDPGFRADHLLKARIALPEWKYSKPEQLILFGDRLLDAIRRLPGVQSATLANGVPMQEVMMHNYQIEGVPLKPGQMSIAVFAGVREGYFETLGVRLLRGRTFTRRDMEPGKLAPILVNEAFALQNWPGQDAIGHVVVQGDSQTDPHGSVVGIVSNTHQLGLDSENRPQVYLPDARLQEPILLVRTAGDPMAMAAAIEKQVWSIDKDQAVYSADTMEHVVHDWDSTRERRFNMTVLIAFAGVALLLAAVGLYGVLAYSVSLRTREIGLRIALGADPQRVARLVVRQGLVLALSGVAVGLAGSLALSRLMASLVFGVKATDAHTFALVAALLVAIAAAASYLPARRAARIDPMAALRAE
jgi:putative ABC transport system permease protein